MKKYTGEGRSRGDEKERQRGSRMHIETSRNRKKIRDHLFMP